MIEFFDHNGRAVCYLTEDGPLYHWSGTPLGKVENGKLHDFSGKFLGWVRKGYMVNL